LANCSNFPFPKNQNKKKKDFAGDSGVKYLPANTGDMGLISGKIPHAVKAARAAELLSLCSRVQEPQLLSPHALQPLLPETREKLKQQQRLSAAPRPRQKSGQSTFQVTKTGLYIYSSRKLKDFR